MSDRISLSQALDYAEAYMLRGERPRVDLAEVVSVLRTPSVSDERLADDLAAIRSRFRDCDAACSVDNCAFRRVESFITAALAVRGTR